jgi:hypothetical protein
MAFLFRKFHLKGSGKAVFVSHYTNHFEDETDVKASSHDDSLFVLKEAIVDLYLLFGLMIPTPNQAAGYRKVYYLMC